MRTLNFSVQGQSIDKVGDFNDLVVGTTGYLQARFAFSDDWTGCRKVAVFNSDDKEVPVLLIGDSCNIPDEITACGSFRVRVVGKRGDAVLTSRRALVIQRRY